MGSPVDFTVRPPGSKSETIRALAAAALAPGRSHLYVPLRADDPKAMVSGLGGLGVEVDSRGEPWSVDGTGGRLEAGSRIDVNESGLSARILIAMAGSAHGVTRIEGRGRLPERPMGGIVSALRSQGVEVSADQLPVEVAGRGRLWGGQMTIDCSESSQFATAAMLVAPTMEERCILELTGLSGSAGYLDGTVSVMQRFGAEVVKTVTGYEIANSGYQPADIVIEPDASAAVYPMAMAAISGGRVVIDGLGTKSWQPDLDVARALEAMGCVVEWHDDRTVVDAREVELAGVNTDMSMAPDGALALAVVCLFAGTRSELTGLGSLRMKESDRLVAISHEISRIGGHVAVEDDSLRIEPSRLHGATIDPHGDHRIAMAMAIAGIRVPGLAVASPTVVNKTWPGFWGLLDRIDA
jgi:3-phosphoshikimate 1-carboxyvinyltransferase